ncbi:ATP-binding cassette domain-containing protein, partial [Akkermansiaceae bacterium]|nr:ATP-binding cassette domain-containing protein [Akkermansiaceae bacterium]
MSFLKLQNLSTHFPVRGGGLISRQTEIIKAVDGVSLEIGQGEILGLVGESGCGKSTLSRTVMQLQPATSGTVTLNGEELTSLPKKEIRSRRLDFQ